MTSRPFHEYFGFRNGGIDKRALGRTDRGFLKALVQGRSLPADARLFLQMNPEQILGVMAGYYIAARKGDPAILKEPVGRMYTRLLMDSREIFPGNLELIDHVSAERNVKPYASDDAAMAGRLMAATTRNPDLQGIITAKCNDSDRRYQFASRLSKEWDPNSEKRIRYTNPIMAHFQNMYDKFLNSGDLFLPETNAAMDLAYRKR